MRDAWVIASVEYGEPAVRSGHLLLAALTNSKVSQLFMGSVRELEKLSPECLAQELRDVTSGTSEDVAVAAVRGACWRSGVRPGRRDPKTPSLDQFTIDLTERPAPARSIPCLGRDFEIRQIIDILTRRRQNNPILTGEAGVGKTAVVEGFALRIAAGDVPPPLQERRGPHARPGPAAGRGRRQGRVREPAEVGHRRGQGLADSRSSCSSTRRTRMIGAGGQAGQGDAANLLKPALARGELRTIAATTWAEYKKYFEKDAALARRFQVVKVEEPTEAARPTA